MVRFTLIDLNPVELKYYPFMINLDEFNWRRNALFPKYVFQKTKEINIKVFNMVTNKNNPKTMPNHVSCNRKRKFNSKTCNSN